MVALFRVSSLRNVAHNIWTWQDADPTDTEERNVDELGTCNVGHEWAWGLDKIKTCCLKQSDGRRFLESVPEAAVAADPCAIPVYDRGSACPWTLNSAYDDDSLNSFPCCQDCIFQDKAMENQMSRMLLRPRLCSGIVKLFWARQKSEAARLSDSERLLFRRGKRLGKYSTMKA